MYSVLHAAMAISAVDSWCDRGFCVSDLSASPAMIDKGT